MEHWEQIFDELLSERVAELLQEKYEKPYSEIKKLREMHVRTMETKLSFLTREQLAAVDTCLDDLIDSCGSDQKFLYGKGVVDGFRLIKWFTKS